LAAGLGVAQLHGVCSLAAMAHTAAGLELLQGYVVVVLLRARMGCCVAGVFAWKEAQMRALLPVGTYALSDEHLQAYLEAQERVIVVTTLQDKAFFQEQWPKHTCLWQAGYPSAWALYTLWQSGMFSQQEQVKALLPFYSRKPVAQPLWATAAPSPVS
jgi:tRNA A37 threonylcarbamoyladenosine modification protein TsaB